MVIIDKGLSFGSNLDFILWGNDDGLTSLSTSDIVPFYTSRIDRVWKVAVNGTPGSVDIHILFPNNTGNAVDYALHIDTDGTFATGASSQPVTSVSGDTITIANITLSNGEYFTLGYSGDLEWAYGTEGNGSSNDWYEDVLVDDFGNTYAVGSFEGLIDLGGVTFTETGSQSVVYAKYNPTGSLVWAQMASGNDRDYGTCITQDGNGNIFIGGWFQSDTLSYPGALSSTGFDHQDMFIAQIDPMTGLVRSEYSADRTASIQSDIIIFDIVADNDYVYATGWAKRGITFQSSPLVAISEIGDKDIFFMKITTTLDSVLWASIHGAGGLNKEESNALALDASGNIYAVGEDGDADCVFYGSPNITLTDRGNDDIWVAKINGSNGQTIWATSIGSNGVDEGNDIIVNGSSVFVTGAIEGPSAYFATTVAPTAVFDTASTAGGKDLFWAEYNLSGDLIRKVVDGGPGSDIGNGISMYNDSSVLITGSFDSTAIFRTEHFLTASGGSDIFAGSYSTLGNLQWLLQPLGGGIEIGRKIASDGTWVSFAGEINGANTTFGLFNPNTVVARGNRDLFAAHVEYYELSLLSENTLTEISVCANIGSDTVIGSYPLGGNGIYTYFWEQSSDSTAWGVASGVNSMRDYVPPLMVQSTYYRRTVSSAGVPSNVSDFIRVLVDSLPVANAGINDTICVGATVNIGGTLNEEDGYSFSWSEAAGSGIVVGGNVSATVTPGISTTYVLTITDTTGVCPDGLDSVIVTVYSRPVADAGADKTICELDFVDIGGGGNSANGYLFSWDNAAGGGSVSGGFVTKNVSPLLTSAYTLTVSDTTGFCPDSIDAVLVNVITTPIADAGTNDSICNGAPANLGGVGNGAEGYNFDWKIGTLPGSIGSGFVSGGFIAEVVFPTVSSIYSVTVSDTAGACPNATDDIIITVYEMPQAMAGGDVAICLGGSTIIGATGNNENGYLYSWDNAAGSGTVASGLVSENVSPIISTAYTLTVSDPAGACPDDTDDVLVQVITPPIANAGIDTTICVGNFINVGDIGNAANGYNYSWNNGAGSGTVVGGLVTESVSPATTTTYTVTVSDTLGSTCPDVTDALIITVIQQPVADAGPDRGMCAGGSISIGGSGNLENGYNFFWDNSGGSGIVSSGGADATVGPGVGTTYTLTISDPTGTCPDAIDQMFVTVGSIPVADAGPDRHICNGDSIAIGGPGNMDAGYDYSWDNGAGIGGVTGGQVTETVAPSSTTLYTLTIEDPGNICSDSIDQMVVIVHEIAVADAGIDATICIGSSINIGGAANSANGYYYSWNNGAGSGFVASGVTAQNVSPDSSITYTLTVTDTTGLCPPDTDSITINVNYPPMANAGVNDSICFGENIQLNGYGGDIYSWVQDGTLDDPDIPNPIASPTATTLYILTVDSLTGCSDSDTVQIVVFALPESFAGSDIEVCGTSQALDADPATGTGTWFFPDGINIVELNNPLAVADANKEGIYTLIWLVYDGYCTNTSEVELSYYGDPVAVAGIDQNLGLSVSTTLSARLPEFGVGTWASASGLVIFNDPTDPYTVAELVSPGEHIVEWTVTNGVCPPSSTEVIITSARFSIPDVITPNGDGLNDQFVITGLEFYEAKELKVFNRWGKEMFSSNDYNNDWNGSIKGGKLLPKDTYYFILTLNNSVKHSGTIRIER